MGKREDIHKVMIIGSGPIVIGQACEFDYSGTQACKALCRLGYEVVLVNSNPATIMTDPGMADVTYLEPLDFESLAEIVAREKPDALLPNLGGQTGLNLSSELAQAGVLDRHGVRVIGVQVAAIERGEDRQSFKETMEQLGIEMARSEIAHSLEEAEAILDRMTLPVVIRPAYTMGGAGGGLVFNRDEFRTVVKRGLATSRVRQVLVEESVVGWEELELEVVRDAKNQMITVCFIENVDAMGVHTGDSFCTAPMLTIDPALQQRLQQYSYAIVEAIEVIGGTNIQFAHDPRTGRVLVIEINPAHVAVVGLGVQSNRIPDRLRVGPAGRRVDVGRDPVLAQRHAGEVRSLGRLRGREVRAVGVREISRLGRQTGDTDAGRRRGDESGQTLQGGTAEGDPLARNRPLRIGIRQGLPRPDT